MFFNYGVTMLCLLGKRMLSTFMHGLSFCNSYISVIEQYVYCRLM